MFTLRALLFTVSFSVFSTSACAESDVVVESMIMPAWVQHAGRTKPLRLGIPLVDGDKIITGEHSRVVLRTADGSDIKLGEHANLTITNLSRPRNDPNLFTAFLDIAKGAFRFTTSSIAKLRQRDVTIHVADATIGIRGTDVWGKDGEDKRVVCLIEGRINIQGKDDSSFIMDQPLTFYDMPLGQPVKAVAPVAADKLAKWALETDISPEQGASTRTGKWVITLLSLTDPASALAAYDEWRAAGYDVNIMPVAATNGHQYRLRISHLASHADAKALAVSLRGKFGALEPVVSQ